MSKRCAIYLRVSTDIQDYKRQKNELKTFAKAYGYTLNDSDIYKDKLSGFKKIDEREGLSELMGKVWNNEFDVVLTWEISRLSRDQIEILQLAKEFQKHKVNLYFKQNSLWLLNKNLEVSSSVRLIMSVLSFTAEDEAERIKERLLSGKRQYVREGKYNGGKITFGYTIKKFGKTDEPSDKKFIIDTKKIDGLDVSKSDIVREVFDLYESGLTASKVALHCKSKGYPKHVTSQHTIARLLRNTSYIGYKETKLGTRPVPSIIEEAQFVTVGKLLDTNKTKADKGRKHTYLLRKVLKCTYCDKLYIGKQTDDTYQCSLNHQTNKFLHGTKCKGSNISVSNVDGVIWERVKDVWVHKKMHGFDNIFAVSNVEKEEAEKEIKRYENLLVPLDDQRKRINRIFETGGYKESEYDDKLGKVKRDEHNIKSKIKELQVKIRSNEKARKRANSVFSRQQDIESITNRKEMKSRISSLIKHITFSKVGLFKTILFVRYQDGKTETILYNSVSKKGNKFKLIDSKFVSYYDEEKCFYFLKEEHHKVASAKNLIEFAKEKLATNRFELPNASNSIKYDFDELLKLDDIPNILSTHEYSKITYFKDLNRKRFSR